MKLTREQIDEMLLAYRCAGMVKSPTYKFEKLNTQALYADEGRYLRLYAERYTNLKHWHRRRHSKKSSTSPMDWERTLWKTDKQEQRHLIHYMAMTPSQGLVAAI